MSSAKNDPEAAIGRHLGQQSDYPERYDPTVLVPIPRSLNRREIGIGSALPFEGCDIWNAYEVSCLLDSGLPLATALRFQYPASSPALVESKSLKLYLNSFNQERLGPDRQTALEQLLQTLQADLRDLLEAPVQVWIPDSLRPKPHPLEHYPLLEEQHPTLEVSQYHASAELLEATERPYGSLQVHSELLRSRCRQTAQPDWGDVFIQMEGSRLPSTESLLRYLVSFRQENHFHEEIVESIFSDLQRRFQPVELLVLAQYTRRGGIDINPLRASPGHPLLGQLSNLERFSPTDRQ